MITDGPERLPKLTHDPVLELSVALSKLVQYKPLDDADFGRVSNAMRDVLDAIPKARRPRVVAEFASVVLEELVGNVVARRKEG